MLYKVIKNCIRNIFEMCFPQISAPSQVDTSVLLSQSGINPKASKIFSHSMSTYFSGQNTN